MFWSLLPAFIFVTLVGAIETVGDGVAIQRVSWRRSRATDFRAVQGAVNADGLGNFTFWIDRNSTEHNLFDERVRYCVDWCRCTRYWYCAWRCLLSSWPFFPKILAVIIAIPGPVAAAYMTVLLGLLFVVGMRVVIQDGADI